MRMLLILLAFSLPAFGQIAATVGVGKSVGSGSTPVSPSFPHSGLIHYWRFEEAQGNDRNDSIGNVHMVEVGGPVPDVAGKYGKAVQGGANDLTTSLTELTVGSGSVQTFTFWVRINSLPTDRYGCFRHALANHPVIEFFPDGTIRFARNPSPVVLSLTLGALNTWHFVVLVCNGTTWSASVDGAALTSDTGYALDAFPGGMEFIYVTPDFFDGDMDEFAIWNAAFSQTQVTALWNGGAGLFLP